MAKGGAAFTGSFKVFTSQVMATTWVWLAILLLSAFVTGWLMRSAWEVPSLPYLRAVKAYFELHVFCSSEARNISRLLSWWGFQIELTNDEHLYQLVAAATTVLGSLGVYNLKGRQLPGA